MDNMNKELKQSKVNVPKPEVKALDSTDLLACPFCGGRNVKAITETPQAMSGSIVSYACVECQDCKSRGPRTDDWNNREYTKQSRLYWNNRKTLR